MKTVLVLGSNSPSGATFCAHALSCGYRVVATSRSLEKPDVFLPYKWGEHSNLSFYKIDLNQDLDSLQELLSKYKPAFVFNFASQSMVGQSWDTPTDWMRTNVVSLVALLELLRNQDYLERYVHFSTPEVYGSTDGWIRESNHFDPSTPYASSRAAGDMNVALWEKTYDLPSIITRAANIYGEGQQLYRIIPKTMLCCLSGKKLPLHGGGLSERAFVHCDDVSNALVEIAERGRNGETYHISPHHKVSIKELVAMICTMGGYDIEQVADIAEDRLGKDQAYLLESSKIKDELGWQPQISLETGLKRCWDWCRQNQNELMGYEWVYHHKA